MYGKRDEDSSLVQERDFMSKQCKGCGQPLQDKEPQHPGYSQNLEQDFCSSCFRLKHYGDLSRVNQSKVDPFETLNKIAQLDALNIWVVDLFHLEESKINSLHRWLKDAPVVLMVTKRELLPQTMSLNKIKNALMPFIKESHLNIIDILITGKFGKMYKDENIKRIKELKLETKKDKVVFFGNTNVGKSTVINALSSKDSLSVSPLPGTTLDLIKVESDIENLYDSAGIAVHEGLLEKLSANRVKSLSTKGIKPVTFQLKDNQSLIIEGYGYFDFEMKGSYSVTCYFPSSISIHRTKLENSLNQFNRMSQEFGELMDEKLVEKKFKLNYNQSDIVILDIGFISIHSQHVKVTSHFRESVELVTRKALL